MEQVQIRDKNRISYALWEENFDIDTYEDIPTFLEIEAKNQHRIYELIREFGLENNLILPCGYRELLSHYGRNI